MLAVSVTVFGRTLLTVTVSRYPHEDDPTPELRPERTIGFHGGSMLYAERSEPLYDGMDPDP